MTFLLPAGLQSGRLGLGIIVAVCMAVALVVYFISLMLLRPFNKSELLQMPMGARIYRLARRVGLMQ